MAILIRTSVMRHCALALLLVALTAAVCIAQTNPELAQHPYVDCPATQTNCNMCQQLDTYIIFCMICADGYSTNVPGGTCEPYSGECTAVGCRRCASNDPTMCIICDEGYTHSIDTMHCLTPVTDSSSEAPVTPSTDAPCLAPNCAVCRSDNSSACATCERRYTLMHHGACRPTGSCTVDNCRQCFSDDDTFCSVCSSGYSLLGTGSCQRRNGAAYAHPTALVAIVMALVAYAATML